MTNDPVVRASLTNDLAVCLSFDSELEREFAMISDEQLELMAGESATSFREAVWKALQDERRRRVQLKEIRERAKAPPDAYPDVGGWTRVSISAKQSTSPEPILATIAAVIASDPLFAAYRWEGYPWDVLVAFPSTLSIPATASALTAAPELMWVRTVGILPEPNVWLGRLLNAPVFQDGIAEGDYLSFRSTNSGLTFEHRVTI